MVDLLAMVLGLNAIAAFATAFFYQARVIFRLRADSSSGTGIGGENSFHANFSRFLAGKIYPDLRSKWGKAVGWVVLSFLALFALGGLAQFI